MVADYVFVQSYSDMNTTNKYGTARQRHILAGAFPPRMPNDESGQKA